MDTPSMKKTASEAINAIAARNGGRVTPEEVIDAARRTDSPLHDYFDWDDNSAAHKYRIEQARGLIREVKITFTVETKTVRSVYYVRDPSMGAKEMGYISVSKVRTESELAREVLVEEFSRVNAVLARAKALATILGLAEDIDQLNEQVASLSQRVLTATPVEAMAAA